MDDWDDHRLILALHRHGTLRACGEALGVTHTTVSRRLAAIEQTEPAPLFLRDGRTLRPTDYGLERVAIAEEMERLDFKADRIRKRSGDGLSGPLSLSVPPAVLQYLLLDGLGTFMRDHPDIDLTVVGTEQLADLDRGEADVVIRGQANPPDHLVGRRICDVTLSHYRHRDYFETVAPKQRVWIGSESNPIWVQSSSYPDYPVGMVIHDIQSRFLALTHGYGLSRAACFMADPHPDLIRLDDRPTVPLYGLWVLTHPDLKSSPRVKALMQAMADTLSAQADLIAA